MAQIGFLKIFLIFVISLKAYFMEDKELFVLKSLYKRDYNAFHYLYESYFSKMVLFAESYVYDEEEAKDLVQDLFFYIWDHADSLLIKTSLKAYLFTSLRNRCLNALRDRKIVDSCNDKLLEAQLFAGIKDIEINETVEMRLQNALNTLPDKCREIILLKIVEGKKNKEIANQLGLAETTVKTQVQRAYRILREQLIPILLFISWLQNGGY